MATIVLLDKSYSTASWIGTQRVMDTIQSRVFCLGEALSDFVPHFAIAGFASNTRRSCEFTLVKDFDDPWLASRGRLANLDAVGYTRIGPALRHAQELLAPFPAARKLILLITDSRPCDYDTYEGAYGIHDIRKAIEVGTQQGLMTHAWPSTIKHAKPSPKCSAPTTLPSFPGQPYCPMPSASFMPDY